MKKIDIFFHSLSFLTLKYKFFRALPVTGSDRNPYQATILTFVYALKKSLGGYLVWGGRDGAPRFRSLKKKLVNNKINIVDFEPVEFDNEARELYEWSQYL